MITIGARQKVAFAPAGIQHRYLTLVTAGRERIERNGELQRHCLGLRIQPVDDGQRSRLVHLRIIFVERNDGDNRLGLGRGTLIRLQKDMQIARFTEYSGHTWNQLLTVEDERIHQVGGGSSAARCKSPPTAPHADC